MTVLNQGSRTGAGRSPAKWCPPRRLLAFLVTGVLLVGLAPPSAAMGPDEALATEVRARLSRDARLRACRLEVEASSGRLHVSGTVPTLALRKEAVRLAAGCRGVLEIDDAIEVVIPSVTDQSVETRLWNRLVLYRDLRAPAVRLRVEDGVVHVEGQVMSMGRRAFLESLVDETEGVVGSDFTALSIGPSNARVDDHDLEQKLRALLTRPTEIPVAGDLDVSCHDGVVTLSGTVPRLIDRMRAAQTASFLPGVKGVQDQLVVDPSFGRPHVP